MALWNSLLYSDSTVTMPRLALCIFCLTKAQAIHTPWRNKKSYSHKTKHKKINLLAGATDLQYIYCPDGESWLCSVYFYRASLCPVSVSGPLLVSSDMVERLLLLQSRPSFALLVNTRRSPSLCPCVRKCVQTHLLTPPGYEDELAMAHHAAPCLQHLWAELGFFFFSLLFSEVEVTFLFKRGHSCSVFPELCCVVKSRQSWEPGHARLNDGCSVGG